MHPQRIVCLAAETPEILQAVGALPRVVGISAYTTRPLEALRLPRVSGFSHASIARILSVRPDLALTTSLVQGPLAAELMAQGIPVVHTSPQRWDDVLASVLLVGGAVGCQHAAEELVAEMHQRFAAVRQQAGATVRRPRVYFEEWDEPALHGIGWVSDIIAAAGGDDVFADRLGSAHRAEHRLVQTADLATRDPEIIFASWCGKRFDRAALCSRPGWQDISAVRRGQVYPLDSCVLQAGPMLLDSLSTMRRIIAAWQPEGAA